MLKLVKYIRQFGWEPIVYTAKDAEYPVIDESLLKDVPEGVTVLRKEIIEPYGFYKRFVGQKKNERVYSGFLSEDKKPTMAQKLSVWIRGNLFIPDARFLWIQPSVKFLTQYLKENPVDVIISTGPPHTTHMIARNIKRKLKVKWVADFRDPWTNIDFYHQLKLTKWADEKHHRLEKSVLQEADGVMTVSWHWAKELGDIRGKQDMHVITNGFDEDDYDNALVAVDEKFSLVHIGSLNPDRNPHTLWKVLKDLCDSEKGFKEKLIIRLIGKTDAAVFKSIEENNLTQIVERIDYLPHSDVNREQRRAAVLLLLLGDMQSVLGLVPGKLFEYLAAKRPILVIGAPSGDSARIVRESGVGDVADFHDYDRTKALVVNMFKRFGENALVVNPVGIEQYNRISIAKKMVDVLNEILNTKQK